MARQRAQTNLERTSRTGPSQTGQAGRSQRSGIWLGIPHLPIQHRGATRVAPPAQSSIACASTSRPLAPRGGETTPSRSICSIIRAARL